MGNRRELTVPAVQGEVTRQAHADLPAGLYEREMGRDGFFGPVSHFYHKNVPTAFEGVTGPITPRAFAPGQAALAVSSPWDVAMLFHNAAVKVRYWKLAETMPHLVRNADGDDLLFVHRGAGELFCDFGHLTIAEGDYVLIPRGTMWRIEITDPAELLVIESPAGRYTMPDWGGVGRHAPFDFGVLDIPRIDDAFRAQQGPGRWELRVKRQEAFGVIRFGYNPLDAQGWKGDLYPVRLNVRDIRPLMSPRLHLPPSAHTTFLGHRFVVCTFVPRTMESDPGAMRLPFFHDNVDYDEILFSHRGPVGSRGGAVSGGGVTYHPMGFTHGPHPETLPRMFDPAVKESNSVLVMVDAQDPLEIGPAAIDCEVADYARTWSGSRAYAPDLEQG